MTTPVPRWAVNGTTFVKTSSIQDAVRGQEERILDALVPDWRQGRPHVTCPYPSHGGASDWRWDKRSAKAYCTCTKADSILDVIMKCEGLQFEETKVRAAEIIGRPDLVRSREAAEVTARFQATDAASLLNASADARDDTLVAAYLAHRLGVDPEAISLPTTPAVGLKALSYFDPPAPGKGDKKPIKVGDFPCIVFGTLAADGKHHAHRIYVAPDGAGKADLGTTADGKSRDPKKSARIVGDDNISGRSVLWGDPAAAPWIITCEGIETGAAIAFAFKTEIQARTVAVAAAISAVGIEAFQPWPSTKSVTIAADRDEKAKPGKSQPSRRGERAARAFGLRHYEAIEVTISLPGSPGQGIDWLDVFTTEGVPAVRSEILAGVLYAPTKAELEGQAQRRNDAEEIERVARTYPLPKLDTMALVYDRTPAGKVKIHKRIEKKDQEFLIPIATPFGVPARLRFVDQADAYGLRIVVQEMGGNAREIDIDRSSLAKMGAADTRALLFGAGLRTEEDGEQIAVACLKAADPESEIMVVRKSGWHQIEGLQDPIFVCPDGEVIGTPDGWSLELSVMSRIGRSIARGGTLQGWKAAAAAAINVQGCEHWTLGVIAGFAGPLISLTGLDTCGINLSGMSSSGKTTAQRLAVSPWSKAASHHRDSLFQTAKSTVNGIESTAARSTGTVLALDELAHVTGKEAGKMIYTFASGVGKKRMTADATIRESYSWSTFVILSSESSIEEKIRADGGEWTAGMAVRVPDVDVTGINRKVDKAIMAKIEAVDTHFGHAGPAFIRGIIMAGLHQKPGVIWAGIMECASRLAGPKADSAVSRAAIPFGILNMAGSLAQEFGLIPANVDLSGVTRWAWERFKQSTDAMALNPELQAVTNLRTWIAERWGVSIRATDIDGAHRDALGWYDEDAVYLPTARLREAAGGTLKESEIAKALDEQGLLAKRKDIQHRFVGYIPRVGRVRAYALSRAEFGRTAWDQEPNSFRIYPGGRP